MPKTVRIIICGLLELSNGCVMLGQITNIGQRFIVVTTLLSFGGICVTTQVSSVVQCLQIRQYWQGKIMQVMISFLISYTMQILILPISEQAIISPLFMACVFLVLISFVLYMNRKKLVAILENMMYNKKKSHLM